MMPDPDDRPALSPATRAAQALGRVDAGTGALVPGIEPATTFARGPDYAPRQPYIYARDGGPTTRHAEAVIADLDGAAETLLFASGMAALVCLTETLEAGDRVAAPRVMYHGAQVWLRRLAARRGVKVVFYDQAAPDGWAEALAGGARWLWVETPANPTWDVADIAAAARAAHAAGARLLVDCTCAPPCAMQALGLGADVAFHAATKYLGGHSDLTAGALSFRDAGLAAEVRGLRTLMGSVLSAFEAWLLIRGLRTLFLRWERACASALTIAQAMDAHPGVDRVLYPGLPAHPGHEVAARQMQGFGAMLSLMIAGDGSEARRLCTRTRLWHPATSLGGVESLIEHRAAVEPEGSEVPPQLVRLSVGIEDAGDLVADLEQALGA